MYRRIESSARFAAHILGLFLALAIVSASASQAREPEACPVDPIPCCTFAGPATDTSRYPLRLGFQIWMHDLPAYAQTITELRPRALRFHIGPSWQTEEEMPLNAGSDDIRAYVERAFGKRRDRYLREIAVLQQLRAQTGAELHLVIWEPPRTKAEPPRSVQGATTKSERRLPPTAVGVTARFYVAFLRALADRGLKVDVVELSNEPNGTWSIKIDPKDYVALLAETRAEAHRRNVSLPAIAGPGVAVISALQKYIDSTDVGTRLLRLLDDVSVHAWDDKIRRNVITEAAKAQELLKARRWHGRLIASELSVTFLSPTDRQQEAGADQRGPNAASNRSPYAPTLIGVVLGLAAQGFDTLIAWQFKDPVWGTTSYGLLDSDGRPRQAFQAWKVLAAVVSGSQVTTVRRADGIVDAFGLYHSDRLVATVLLNRESRVAAYEFDRRAIASDKSLCISPRGKLAVKLEGGDVLVLRNL